MLRALNALVESRGLGVIRACADDIGASLLARSALITIAPHFAVMKRQRDYI